MDNKITTEKSFRRLSPKMALELAAPHTWPAAILPVLLAVVLAVADSAPVSITLTCTLLLICILMQSSVNAINDYYDFVKGTDTLENQDDPTDAVLVYNAVNPRSALFLSLGFLLLGACLGVYVVALAGWIPLAIGIFGALVIVLYSAGKNPLSYLPIGEYVSGITMGVLIPSASYIALTNDFSWRLVVFAIPVALGIGLIMFTNNTCDIDKDIDAGRKTQSVLLGHARARKAYHIVMYAWLFCIVLVLALYLPRGLLIVPFMLTILYPTFKNLYTNPLEPSSRGQAMGLCLNLNIGLGAFYFIAILVGSLSSLTL